jgi:hypothetical protein
MLTRVGTRLFKNQHWLNVQCSHFHTATHTHRVNGAAYVLTYTYNNDEHSGWHAKCVARVVGIRVFTSKPRLLVCVCDRLIVGGVFVRSVVGSRNFYFFLLWGLQKSLVLQRKPYRLRKTLLQLGHFCSVSGGGECW